jgi:outer membrane protein TolC
MMRTAFRSCFRCGLRGGFRPSAHARPRRAPQSVHRAVALACAAWAWAVAAPAVARCIDEDAPDPVAAREASPAPADPRATLAAMVAEALQRSNALGAAQLLTEAALQDVAEARSAKAVQASLGGGLGPAGSRSVGITETSDLQLRANISVSQLLYDGGRSDRMVDWRTQLAESARLGQLSQQEQIALTTVALALERSRYRMTVLVWRAHVRKMGCLVESLETITRNDRGRASELVQARKSLQQAELTLTQTQSAVRQVEVRLRRLVGDGLPGSDGLTAVFSSVPELPQLLADAEHASDIAQLDAQALAARRYAEAVDAGRKPQLSWALNGGANAGAGGNVGPTRSGSYSVGLVLSVPLMAPGLEAATESARKRAQATVLQRAEVLEQRRFRLIEVHEQATATLDRARRVAEVLRDSDQVRNFTLQQWQQLGRRSLFDVMAAESDHFNMRVAYVNALHDVQQLDANLLSLGRGVLDWLR